MRPVTIDLKLIVDLIEAHSPHGRPQSECQRLDADWRPPSFPASQPALQCFFEHRPKRPLVASRDRAELFQQSIVDVDRCPHKRIMMRR